MKTRKITNIIILCLFAAMGITVGALIGNNSQLKTELVNANARPIPVITMTTTVTSPPKIIKKIQIKYKNGYVHIGDDPVWNCAGNWYNAYIRLANNPNMPTGDTSLWNYYCPNIPMPGN